MKTVVRVIFRPLNMGLADMISIASFYFVRLSKYGEADNTFGTTWLLEMEFEHIWESIKMLNKIVAAQRNDGAAGFEILNYEHDGFGCWKGKSLFDKE